MDEVDTPSRDVQGSFGHETRYKSELVEEVYDVIYCMFIIDNIINIRHYVNKQVYR